MSYYRNVQLATPGDCYAQTPKRRVQSLSLHRKSLTLKFTIVLRSCWKSFKHCDMNTTGRTSCFNFKALTFHEHQGANSHLNLWTCINHISFGMNIKITGRRPHLDEEKGTLCGWCWDVLP